MGPGRRPARGCRRRPPTEATSTLQPCLMRGKPRTSGTPAIRCGGAGPPRLLRATSYVHCGVWDGHTRLCQCGQQSRGLYSPKRVAAEKRGGPDKPPCGCIAGHWAPPDWSCSRWGARQGHRGVCLSSLTEMEPPTDRDRGRFPLMPDESESAANVSSRRVGSPFGRHWTSPATSRPRAATTCAARRHTTRRRPAPRRPGARRVGRRVAVSRPKRRRYRDHDPPGL